MLKITNPTGSSTILQSSIDAADEDKVGGDKNYDNKTNLSNPSTSKRSIKAGYLTSKSAKKGGNNPKRGGGNTKKVSKPLKALIT